jgi:hypothetical protein
MERKYIRADLERMASGVRQEIFKESQRYVPLNAIRIRLNGSMDIFLAENQEKICTG